MQPFETFPLLGLPESSRIELLPKTKKLLSGIIHFVTFYHLYDSQPLTCFKIDLPVA
jgi:hypothetical protein